jgi:hypothetical protein
MAHLARKETKGKIRKTEQRFNREVVDAREGIKKNAVSLFPRFRLMTGWNEPF